MRLLIKITIIEPIINTETAPEGQKQRNEKVQERQ